MLITISKKSNLLFLKVLIGIFINIIIFPPIILLVELFRRSRKYIERKEKIYKILKNIEKSNTTRIESKIEYLDNLKDSKKDYIEKEYKLKKVKEKIE